MHTTNSAVTMAVEPDVANAIVEAVTVEVTTIGAHLEGAPIDTPGDLARIRRNCGRITRLAAINEQLHWRTHHGKYQSDEERAALGLSITADEATLLDLAGVLRQCADTWTDDEGVTAAFANASRAVARGVGAIEAAQP